MPMHFLHDFVDVTRNFKYDNTYKAAWAKALVEIAYESEDTPTPVVVISLQTIAKKILKYYWNQTIFFDLIQGSNPSKPPKILSLTKTLIEKHQEASETLVPIRFERIEHILSHTTIWHQTVNKTVTVLKQDVSYRFLNLNNTILPLYQYAKGDDRLIITTENLLTLKAYAFMLFDLINYRWSLILETFNSSPRIGKKVKIIDEDSIPRSSLNAYFDLIALDNPNKICFLCGQPIEEKPAIDHVIPWSYMYSDDIWNLVFVHRSCNSSKGNLIPNEDSIYKLEQRNERLLQIMEDNGLSNKRYMELKMAHEENLVKKFWIGCQ